MFYITIICRLALWPRPGHQEHDRDSGEKTDMNNDNGCQWVAPPIVRPLQKPTRVTKWWSSLSRMKLASLVVIIPITVIFVVVYVVPDGGVHYGTVTTVTSVIPTSAAPTMKTNMKIRYKHTQRRLPQCIIIGIRKAGTRALLKFLDLHPSIQTAAREIHFFDNSYDLGLNWYRKRMPFSFPDQITIEKTPAYFTVSSVAELVHRMNSTIKLLLIVRDPTERAVSDWLQLCMNQRAKNMQCTPFERKVIDPHTGKVNRSYKGIRRSIYVNHLRNWLQWFPLSQIHIVNGKILVTNPVVALRRVEQFLGLKHRITEDHFYFNKSRGFYCIQYDSSRRKCLHPSKGRKHPKMKREIIQKLRDFFRPFNHKFYRMVGQDFGWT